MDENKKGMPGRECGISDLSFAEGDFWTERDCWSGIQVSEKIRQQTVVELVVIPVDFYEKTTGEKLATG